MQEASLSSCVFETQDDSLWVVELVTRSKDRFSVDLVIHAIPTPEDLISGFKPRKLVVCH
jgi:hypothetical protein